MLGRWDYLKKAASRLEPAGPDAWELREPDRKNYESIALFAILSQWKLGDSALVVRLVRRAAPRFHPIERTGITFIPFPLPFFATNPKPRYERL